MTNSGERPADRISPARSTARANSACHCPASTASPASSPMTSNPCASAQSICSAVTDDTDPDTAAICSTAAAAIAAGAAGSRPAARQ